MSWGCRVSPFGPANSNRNICNQYYAEISTYGDIWIWRNLRTQGDRSSVQIFPYIKAGSGYEEISTYGDIVWIWGNIFTSQTECAEISTYGDFVRKWGNILTRVHRLDVQRFLHMVTYSDWMCGDFYIQWHSPEMGKYPYTSSQTTYGDVLWMRGNLCTQGERPSVQRCPHIKA